MANPPLLRTALGCAIATLTPGLAAATTDQPPPGVEQILPRGSIPAIVGPRFVPAGEAEIDHDAWVLGVLLEGEARAYSLNLLNRHEVVNDSIAGRDFAAVW